MLWQLIVTLTWHRAGQSKPQLVKKADTEEAPADLALARRLAVLRPPRWFCRAVAVSALPLGLLLPVLRDLALHLEHWGVVGMERVVHELAVTMVLGVQQLGRLLLQQHVRLRLCGWHGSAEAEAGILRVAGRCHICLHLHRCFSC